jgi:hypothetical protein
MNNLGLDDLLNDLRPLEPYWPALATVGGLLVLWIFFRIVRGHGELPNIVLKEFYASTTPEEDYYVVIGGRPRGIGSLLLSLIGLGTKVRFEVSKDSVQCQITNWHERIRDTVPLPNVASAGYGYSKRTAYLFLAILAILGSIAAAALALVSVGQQGGFDEVAVSICSASAGGIVMSLLMFVLYYLSHRFVVAIETNGGRPIGVQFKRGMFGSPVIDLRDAAEVIDIINSLIRAGATDGDGAR